MNEQTKTNKLDLSKYRTPELVGTFVELLSVPGMMLDVVKSTVGSNMFWFVCILVLCFVSSQPLISGKAITMIVYGFIAGTLTGVAFGIVRIASKGLRNISGIMNHLLAIVGFAANDAEAIRDGSGSLPTASEITYAVHSQILMPTLETAFAKGLGVLGTPVLWIYRISIGNAVRRMTYHMDSNRLVKKSGGMKADKVVETSIQAVGEYEAEISDSLKTAHAFVDQLSTKFRWIILIPVFAVFLFSVLVAITPLFVVWYFL